MNAMSLLNQLMQQGQPLEQDWRQWLGRSASRASLHKLDYAPKVEAPGDNRHWLPQAAPTRNARSLLCA